MSSEVIAIAQMYQTAKTEDNSLQVVSCDLEQSFTHLCAKLLTPSVPINKNKKNTSTSANVNGKLTTQTDKDTVLIFHVLKFQALSSTRATNK